MRAMTERLSDCIVAHFHGGPCDGRRSLVWRRQLPEGLRPYCELDHLGRVHRYEARDEYTEETEAVDVFHVGVMG